MISPLIGHDVAGEHFQIACEGDPRGSAFGLRVVFGGRCGESEFFFAWSSENSSGLSRELFVCGKILSVDKDEKRGGTVDATP
ncbi:hypothetical protein [Acidocella sp.]|uniref:hypothetical protein n=1 Tax=Acidocella sp. TaxID=50710 RepID=UPI003D023AAA